MIIIGLTGHVELAHRLRAAHEFVGGLGAHALRLRTLVVRVVAVVLTAATIALCVRNGGQQRNGRQQ